MSSIGKNNGEYGQTTGLLQEDHLCNRGHDKEETSLPQTVSPDRWEFLKSLPHKFIRDIGFVIASPDLLLDSFELPTVSADMLGGSTRKWKESEKWLKALDAQHVIDWFAARKNRTRLGDHFAACIEYVLRYSPVVQVERLIISQQVMQKMKTASTSTGYQNTKIRSASDLLESDSKQSERCNISTSWTDLSQINILQMNDGGSLDVPSTEEVANDAVMPFGDSCGNQRQKNKLLKKMGKLKSGKTVTRTIGEFDFLFQCSNVNQDAKSVNGSKQSIEYGSNIEDCMKAGQGASELELSHKTTIEEEVYHWEVSVKFLLYAGPWEVFGLNSPEYATWNVKNLDEALVESCLCDEHNSKDRILENLDENKCEIPPVHSIITMASSCDSSECAWGTDEFLGCFLGPHIGETLRDRKTRLYNQLALSQNSIAASYLYRTYIISDCNKTDMPPSKENMDSSQEVQQSGCFSVGQITDQEKKSVETENKSMLKIVPGALLKGYLFYEYELWHLLRGTRRDNKFLNTSDFCTRLIVNCTKESQAVDIKATDKTLPKWQKNTISQNNYQLQCSCLTSKEAGAKLNPQHWMGWWTHINEFAKFAECSCSEKSKWYIVPKQEWLSPVIVDGSDVEGCAKVMKLEEFLVVASKVAEEAALSQIPRKRRFMVAEVHWEADFMSPEGLNSQLEDNNNFSSHSFGAWIEVSRGFVVEETWPDSRVYRPHGYVPNWSPSLQGLD